MGRFKKRLIDGKRLKITTNNGNFYEGLAIDFTPADENTPEIDSICISDIEFFADEIRSIKLA